MAAKNIQANQLQRWLEEGRTVTVLDVRPEGERKEWHIPESIHLNIYDKLKTNASQAFSGITLDKKIPVVVVCASGKTSLKAAYQLVKDGHEAYSLEGGMKGWSLSWNTATIDIGNTKVIQVRRTGKGCLSYIVASGSKAVIIDASLPINVYQEILRDNNLTLQAVLETHVHADHLSRSKQLADSNHVPLYLPVDSKVQFPFLPLYHDGVVTVGDANLKVIHTPGHTYESISLLIDNKVLFSGDTLFTNSIGRPDLKADETEARKRATLLFKSLKTLLILPSETIILPAHTSSPVAFDHTPIQTTIGELREKITILRLPEREFVDAVLKRIPPPPENYHTIANINSAGDFTNEGDINDLETGANRCAI